MFIPISSDAQLIHWPIMTGVMILLNLVAYPVQMSLPSYEREVDLRQQYGDEAIEQMRDDARLSDEIREAIASGGPVIDSRKVPGYHWLALSHGEGLNPLQWVASMFMHSSVVHLLGNILFLWVFGLVVEGRVGPFWFAIAYLGCGILQSALEQLLFIHSPGRPSLGASSAIFALITIAALWAPGDNIQWLSISRWWGAQLVEIPILILAAIYMVGDFGLSIFDSFKLSTPLLHVMGGAIGLVAGGVPLTLNLVDCDQQDMLSRWRVMWGGKPLPAHPKKKSRAQLAAEEHIRVSQEQRLAVIDKTLDLHLDAGRTDQALATMKSRRQVLPGSQWEEPRLLKLLGLLQQQKRWDEFLAFADDFDKRFDSRDVPIRLNVARIQLEEKGRPRKCVQVLKGIDQAALNPKQREALTRLANIAKQRIAAGELDFVD